MTAINCPCGKEKPYSSCCGKAHLDSTSVQTAEDLMRSRYSAFTLANGDYLMKSHHSSTRPISEKQEIENWAKSVKWLKLEILNTSKGSKADAEGTVEFKAHYKERGRKKFIHEKSKFIREYGVWVYLGKE